MTVTPTKPADPLVPAKGAKTAPSRRKRVNGKQILAIWLFLLPAAVLGLYFKFIPMVEGIRLSLFKVQPFLGDVFIGFDNYINVLKDARFMDALGHTVVLGVTQTLGALVVGFVLALLLEGQARSLWVLRTTIFLPVVTALAVASRLPARRAFLRLRVGFRPFVVTPNPCTHVFSSHISPSLLLRGLRVGR